MKLTDPTYKQWLTELKGKIRSVQLKAAVAVNSALIRFYWELGKMISEKQAIWGSKFLVNLSKDLQDEFSEMKGFSVSNLKICKLFFEYFSSQLVNQNGNVKTTMMNQNKSGSQIGDVSEQALVTELILAQTVEI